MDLLNYEGCGVAYSYKTAFKNGVEHGNWQYIEMMRDIFL